MSSTPWPGKQRRLRGWIFAALVLFGLWVPLSASARTVAGVELPAQLNLEGRSGPLVLNGAGIRYKWFFKIYVAALYLPQPQQRVERVLAMEAPGAVTMHFLYEEISAEKLRDAWTAGVKNNASEKAFARLQTRLQRFNEFFTGVVRGDVVRLEFLPQQGTAVYLNGDRLGNIEGRDFSAALLKVWLGEVPIDHELKEAMLGR